MPKPTSAQKVRLSRKPSVRVQTTSAWMDAPREGFTALMAQHFEQMPSQPMQMTGVQYQTVQTWE